MIEWSVNLELDGSFTQDQAEDLIDALGERAAAAVSVSPTRLGIRFYIEAVFAHDAIERAFTIVQKHLAQPVAIASAEVETPEELDRMLAEPTFPDLLGVTEVARLLRVSRQRVDELLRTREDFPKPVVELAAGPIWKKVAIVRFLDEWPRKSGRPSKVDQQRRQAAIHAAMLGTGDMTGVARLGEEHPAVARKLRTMPAAQRLAAARKTAPRRRRKAGTR